MFDSNALKFVIKNVAVFSHYANMSMYYTVIFHSCENGYFPMKNCDIFLLFAQNIDCGYTSEPPQ